MYWNSCKKLRPGTRIVKHYALSEHFRYRTPTTVTLGNYCFFGEHELYQPKVTFPNCPCYGFCTPLTVWERLNEYFAWTYLRVRRKQLGHSWHEEVNCLRFSILKLWKVFAIFGYLFCTIKSQANNENINMDVRSILKSCCAQFIWK